MAGLILTLLALRHCSNLSPYGLRAMARTLLGEEFRYCVDFIEHQLAHAVKDRWRCAHNRTKY